VATALAELRDGTQWNWPYDMHPEIIRGLPDSVLGSVLDIALAHADRSRRASVLRALIPRLDAASREQPLEVWLADVFANERLYAMNQLDAGFPFLAGSSDHRRLICRELVKRLYASRNHERSRVLFALESSPVLTEALLPRSVLAAIATRLLAVYSDWSWP
jgi:hypothetical protein